MEKDKKKPVFVYQPEYPGGPKEISKFIQQHLRYPDKAMSAGAEGTVIVEFDIDHKGKVVGTRVLQSVGHGCDEEACRVVKLLQFDVPKNRGMRVLFHKKTHIHFRKPAKQPAAAAPSLPQSPMQITYTYTTSAPTPPSTEEGKQAPVETYTYSIQI
ncbi:MAG TPA: energy transducer TonB [Saprospiraceae bacterium]|nr:energy transducer TonB [Saprospiraceae bacterium]